MRREVLAQLKNWGRGVELLIIQHTDYGTFITPPPPDSVKAEEGALPEPTLVVSNQEAQQLMDELWRCGFRPTEGSGSAGSLAATQHHLRDMRAIALGLLRKDGVSLGEMK